MSTDVKNLRQLAKQLRHSAEVLDMQANDQELNEIKLPVPKGPAFLQNFEWDLCPDFVTSYHARWNLVGNPIDDVGRDWRKAVREFKDLVVKRVGYFDKSYGNWNEVVNNLTKIGGPKLVLDRLSSPRTGGLTLIWKHLRNEELREILAKHSSLTYNNLLDAEKILIDKGEYIQKSLAGFTACLESVQQQMREE